MPQEKSKTMPMKAKRGVYYGIYASSECNWEDQFNLLSITHTSNKHFFH